MIRDAIRPFERNGSTETGDGIHDESHFPRATFPPPHDSGF
jgi:hypothetical protein